MSDEQSTSEHEDVEAHGLNGHPGLNGNGGLNGHPANDDADVEAHGLREKALIFTVAATSAVGTGAGIANAAIPANFADGGGPSNDRNRSSASGSSGLAIC